MAPPPQLFKPLQQKLTLGARSDLPLTRMVIGHWSRRRIRQVWLIACVVQASFAGLALWSWVQIVDDLSAGGEFSAVAATPGDSASRARGERLMRDSLGLGFERHGDTLVVQPISPRGEAVAAEVSGVAIGIVWEPGTPLQLVIGSLAFFSPLLVAAVLTVVWRRERLMAGYRGA